MSRLKYEYFLHFDCDDFIKSSEKHYEKGTAIYDFAIKDKENKNIPNYNFENLNVEYVRMSGHGVWLSILLITEAYLIKRLKDATNSNETLTLMNVKHYQKALSQLVKEELKNKNPDKKLIREASEILKEFKDLYDKLHIEMGYDGGVIPIDAFKYFEEAKRYINRIKNLL